MKRQYRRGQRSSHLLLLGVRDRHRVLPVYRQNLAQSLIKDLPRRIISFPRRTYQGMQPVKRRIFIFLPDQTDIPKHVIVQPVEPPEAAAPAKPLEPCNKRPPQSL